MWKIKESLVLDLMAAAKNNYPKEFASLLGGNRKKQQITEFVVPPVLSGSSFATIDLVALPVDESIIGSVHSHPAGSGNPSAADKKLFRRYPVNIILFPPYNKLSFRVFGSEGEETEHRIFTGENTQS